MGRRIGLSIANEGDIIQAILEEKKELKKGKGKKKKKKKKHKMAFTGELCPSP